MDNDACHGDENIVECDDLTCAGESSLWCSCQEKAEQERERLNELYANDLLRGDDG